MLRSFALLALAAIACAVAIVVLMSGADAQAAQRFAGGVALVLAQPPVPAAATAPSVGTSLRPGRIA
jgi:hypothetical protein